MTKLYRLAAVLVISAFAAGCANQKVQPSTVLCPLLGSVLGAGIVAGGLGGDDAGPMAAGAVIGAGLGHFLCKDKSEPPAPKPAPRPAPKPAPKPAPPPPKDSDGDGVIDPNDECPGTPAGVPDCTAGFTCRVEPPVKTTTVPPAFCAWIAVLLKVSAVAAAAAANMNRLVNFITFSLKVSLFLSDSPI